jgi:hypothetical protein
VAVVTTWLAPEPESERRYEEVAHRLHMGGAGRSYEARP